MPMNEDWIALLREHAHSLPDFEALETEHHTGLYKAVEATLAREEAALDRALEEALSIVPRLLRGPVKKLVLG